MKLEKLDIPGVYRIAIEPAADERGFFARTFCAETFAKWGLATDFVQRSMSYNKKRGTLRGLHYQAEPHAETKLVRCSRGAAFDVIVDLRPKSAYFGAWETIELSAENRHMIYIPAGCAHGFQTLVDDTELLYEITPAYVPEAARGVRWNDPALAIPWPMANPVVSAKDSGLPLLER